MKIPIGLEHDQLVIKKGERVIAPPFGSTLST